MIFLISLAGIFIFRSKWGVTVCALVLFFSGLLQLVPIPPPDPEIVLIRHGSAPVPAVVFCDPASGKATVWNVPQGSTARLIADYLKTRGVNEIEEIHFDSARREICGGGPFLLNAFPVKSVYFHDKIRQNAKTAKHIQETHPAPVSKPVLTLQKAENQTEAVPGYAAMKHISVRMTISENNGAVIEIVLPDQTLQKEYPFGSRTILERITLPRQKRAEWKSLLSR